MKIFVTNRSKLKKLIRADKGKRVGSGGQVLGVKGFAEQLQQQGNRDGFGQCGCFAGQAATRVDIGGAQGRNHVDQGMFCFGRIGQGLEHGKAIQLGQVQIHDQNVGVEIASGDQTFQAILLAAQFDREGQMLHRHAVDGQQIQIVFNDQYTQAGFTATNGQAGCDRGIGCDLGAGVPLALLQDGLDGVAVNASVPTLGFPGFQCPGFYPKLYGAYRYAQ